MKFKSKNKDVSVAVAIKPGSLVDEHKVQSYVNELAQLIQSHIDKGRGLNEVRQMQKIAGILKEDGIDLNLSDPLDYKSIEDQIKNKVEHYYGDQNPTPEQVRKLVAIYKHQMEFEDRTDVEDFFEELIDSSDPDAFISLRDLKKYKGY